MPQAFRLILNLDGDGVPSPEHLRGFASGLFERGIEGDHHGQAKPYTIGRLVPLGGRAWSLDATVLTDTLAEVAADRMAPGLRIFLGPLRGVLSHAPVTIADRSWTELAHSIPITGAQFSFDTPVVVRSRVRDVARPTAKDIFGHLRRRWRRWDPETAPDVDLSSVMFHIERVGVHFPVRLPKSSEGMSYRSFTYDTVDAFVGTVTTDVVRAEPVARVALGALSQAAPFLGVGSSTTSGFGATSLLALWDYE